MTKIVIYGASAEDKAYFKHALNQHGAHIQYRPTPLLLDDLDSDTSILCVFVDTMVTKEVIQALPELKLIACRSTGTDNIDMEAAKTRGIVVANVPSYGSSTVAEYAMTLLLMLTRRMQSVLMQSGTTHPNREEERGTDLFGKTMGIIGTGHIGMSAARIAIGFGMKVVGYDLHPRPEEAGKIGFRYADDLDMLLKASDIVSLHVPYLPSNHHLLSKQRLGKLKHGAIIINTARGELIDTTALVDALRYEHVSGAALDVLESEYLLEPDELIALAAHNDAAKATLRHAVSLAALQRMPNVIITNHNAYNTREAIERINETTAQNILNFLNGKEVHAV